ncbi:MAG: hypothetical protein B7X08_00185 [Acidocella sp. 20-63-7]|nr:MAG: hypothetical protein B7X08_00185 [Acidocella sp. 20-63-7]
MPLIDRALAAPGWLPRLPPALRADYKADRLLQCRLFNRRLLLVLTLIFDLYWFNQQSAAPEILPLSTLLRFCVLSPAVLVFLVLDWRGLPGRFYGVGLFVLALLPALISAVLCVHTTSAAELLDIRATPLILLGSSMALRLPLVEMILNATLTAALFILSLLFCPVLEHAELGSLSLIEISIAITSVGFNLQLEWRDRRVFLLNVAERIMRTELTARNRGLIRETLTDTLTGIANRRCFEETIATLWREGLRNSAPVGLIMVDVDHFKAFNDHYGHQRGDECLRLVALKMSGQLRANDVLARYGGEEFAVLLPDASLETVYAVAERIRVAVESLRLPHRALGQQAVLTVSLGVASLVPANASGIHRLIAEADSALYGAKRSGRNSIGQKPGAARPGPFATLREQGGAS